MQDHVNRLVGLGDFEVKVVIEEGDELDLEVEFGAGDELVVDARPVEVGTPDRAEVAAVPLSQ